MMQLVCRLLFAACVASVGAVPRQRSVRGNFIGEGTDEIATALLQGFAQEDDNIVFSPLGYSTILAIFAEGARGPSREEIATALHFPEDVNAVREAYKAVLERLTTKKKPGNAPEFKNWFYIYKNYSVEEELQDVLRSFYLTEVKSVDRFDGSSENEKKVSQVSQEKEKEQAAEVDKAVEMAESAHKVDSEEAATNNQQALLADKPGKGNGETKAPEEDKPLPGINNNKERVQVGCVEENVPEESSPVQSGDKKEEGETMVAMQRSDHAGGSGPIDHFSGMTDSSLRIKGREPQSQMIIFNGMYYRGDWQIPFVKKKADDSRVFYKSETEKISVSTIHSEGTFNSGVIQSLDSRAIELPYKGGRYSLLILVPNSRDGLTKLVADLSGYPIKNVFENMTEKAHEVCLPCFQMDTISKPISSFSKLGLSKVTSIFDPEKADLSGISKQDPGLFVEELVQTVTFKVDADYSDANFLTASMASSRTDYEKFQINQPFLFFLRDKVDDIIIVNGKLVDPTPKPDFFES